LTGDDVYVASQQTTFYVEEDVSIVAGAGRDTQSGRIDGVVVVSGELVDA
jgi:hypothetical protein